MTIEDLRREVFARRVLLGEVANTWRTATCLEFALTIHEELLPPTDILLDALEAEISPVLGVELARRARLSLEEKKWVSTADHHGLLNHPYFYTSALTRSHKKARPQADATVVLSFGNISLSNDSFPRGFFFHDATLTLRRFHFKSLHERRMPVCTLAPMSRDTFQKECARVRSLKLSPSARTHLGDFLEVVLATERVWTQETYSAQLTVLNHLVWRSLFGDTRGDLVYCEIESVVRRLFLEEHLVQGTVLHRLLFDAAWRRMYLELFEGISGAHSTEGALRGTHFFWLADKRTHSRRQLVVRDGALTTPEGDWVVPLTPEAVYEKLLTRELVPGTALSLLTIHVEGLLACAGGLSQIEYLKHIVDRFEVLLEYFGEMHPMPHPSIFSGEHALLGLKRADGAVELASLFDVLLYLEGDRGALIDAALEVAPFCATLDAMMPTLYALLTREISPLRVVHPSHLISHV